MSYASAQTFLVHFAPTVELRVIRDFIDRMDDVHYWQTVLPSSLFICTYTSANVISDRIHEKFPALRYIVVPVTSGESQGFMPGSTWYLIRNPADPKAPPK
jgi:hypothetical protein